MSAPSKPRKTPHTVAKKGDSVRFNTSDMNINGKKIEVSYIIDSGRDRVDIYAPKKDIPKGVFRDNQFPDMASLYDGDKGYDAALKAATKSMVAIHKKEMMFFKKRLAKEPNVRPLYDSAKDEAEYWQRIYEREYSVKSVGRKAAATKRSTKWHQQKITKTTKKRSIFSRK